MGTPYLRVRYSPVMTARLRVHLRDGDGPPYRQLIESVRRQIERGALLPGDRLPPVRTLADDLALAPNTVARAYRALEDDGWIEGRGRAGTFVADRLPERVTPVDAALAKAADDYLRRAAQLGVDREGAILAIRDRRI
jgi:GntR family transcriptional regulator